MPPHLQANVAALMWLYTMPPGPPPAEPETPNSSRPSSSVSSRSAASLSSSAKLRQADEHTLKVYAPHVSDEAKAKILQRIELLHQVSILLDVHARCCL